MIIDGTSKEDSILIVKNFIDGWTSQKLLIKAADVNLNDEKKNKFNALVKQYKIDLFTKAYIEEIVKNSVNTLIFSKELKEFYNQNKENFRTNQTLVQLRYINLPKDHLKFENIKYKFINFKKKLKNHSEITINCNLKIQL